MGIIMYTILIIEDDAVIRAELKLLLENALYRVLTIEGFEGVAEQVKMAAADLILMDVTLPGEDGLQLCQQIRGFSNIPIIFVTSKNTAMDELGGMMIGGDDYISKPYHVPVLLARIAAVLKRLGKSAEESGEHLMFCKGCELNLWNSTIRCSDKIAELTKNEMRICLHLFTHSGQIVARADLIEDLWENEIFIDDNTLSVNITRIRNKLKDIGAGELIQTKRGRGYLI